MYLCKSTGEIKHYKDKQIFNMHICSIVQHWVIFITIIKSLAYKVSFCLPHWKESLTHYSCVVWKQTG